MAAYAALLSLNNTIHQINQHPHPPISLHEQQQFLLLEDFESLSQHLTFFQDFLENHSFQNDGLELEGRIAKAAYTAEDNIETHVMIQIRFGSTSESREKIATDFHGGLQKILEDMDSIKKEVLSSMELKQKTEGAQHQNSTAPPSSSSTPRKNDGATVGLDHVQIELMDKLVGGPLHLQVIPVTGMGGIGKTTLAQNIYRHATVVEHFDYLAWVTISQEYIMMKIFTDLLHEDLHLHLHENKDEDEDKDKDKDDESEVGLKLQKKLDDERKVGLKLYKKLFGWRYLIVVDDLWDIKVWDQLKTYLPKNNKGSRIVVTTRLSNLADQISDSRGIKMGFLDKLSSWNLFCKIVFGGDDCPPELESIGVEMVQSCKGLPLSIVVIGGILVARPEQARTQAQTQQYWKDTAQSLNQIVNSDDDEHCLRILYMSYNSLPVYLKPCFLHLGIFKEDSEIRASPLSKLWVAEGFLRPESGKTLEEVALDCLEKLVDRNLVLAEKRNHCGKLKVCKVHDLLRDLCLREARGSKFLCVPTTNKPDIPQDLEGGRRISLYEIVKEGEYFYPHGVVARLQGAMMARSLMWAPYLPEEGLPLLRVYSTEDISCNRLLDDLHWRINFRYVNVRRSTAALHFETSRYSHLWNLQSLILRYKYRVHAPSSIWEMSQLRHVQINPSVKLPAPPPHDDDDEEEDVRVLQNLQTLSTVGNFDGEVVRRIPNVKKLKISGFQDYNSCLENFGSLQKLTSLSLAISSAMGMMNASLPRSLEKLVLRGCRLGWEEMAAIAGPLPRLQVLKLREGACVGPTWVTVEEQFVSLVYLEIEGCEVEDWECEDGSHFPRLRRVVLRGLEELKEVPSSVGEIPTLELLSLENCSRSAVESAVRIREEQEEYGNVGLRVLLPTFYEKEEEEEGEEEVGDE